jgi:hypothetical protein
LGGRTSDFHRVVRCIPVAIVNLEIGLFLLLLSWISSIVISRRSRKRKKYLVHAQAQSGGENEGSILSQLAKTPIGEKDD